MRELFSCWLVFICSSKNKIECKCNLRMAGIWENALRYDGTIHCVVRVSLATMLSSTMCHPPVVDFGSSRREDAHLCTMVFEVAKP
jgi:hypothetical protein